MNTAIPVSDRLGDYESYSVKKQDLNNKRGTLLPSGYTSSTHCKGPGSNNLRRIR